MESIFVMFSFFFQIDLQVGFPEEPAGFMEAIEERPFFQRNLIKLITWGWAQGGRDLSLSGWVRVDATLSSTLNASVYMCVCH